MTHKTGTYILLFLQLLFLLYVSIISPAFAMTIDEAWNFMFISRFGFLYALTHYPAANNHIVFTALQALIVPPNILWSYPYFLRITNVFAGTALFMLLYFFLCTFLSKKSFLWSMVIFVTFFFISPTVTTYFIVARGYILGIVFLLSGIYVLTSRRYVPAAVLFILSGWTIPTYIYTLPLIYFGSLVFGRRDDRNAVMYAAVGTILGLLLCYVPVIRSVLAQTNAVGNLSLPQYITETRLFLTNYSYSPYGNIFNMVYIAIYIISLAVIFRARVPAKFKLFILSLTSSIASYLGCIIVLSITHVARPPYLRNGIFIPIFIAITIVCTLAITRHLWLKILISVIILGNISLGMIFFRNLLRDHQKSFYMGFYEKYSISQSEISLLQQKIMPSLPKAIWTEGPVLEYFSYVYSVPIQSISADKVSQNDSIRVTPKNEPTPWILPTNPLYVIRRLWQYVSLKDTEVISPTFVRPRIIYLLSESDITYAEAHILWKQKLYDISLQTLAHAENDVTILAGNIDVLFGYGDIDQGLINDILPSIALHQNIIKQMRAQTSGTYDEELSHIEDISLQNLHTIKSLMIY